MAQVYETRITDDESNLFAHFVSVPARSVENLQYLEDPRLFLEQAGLRVAGDITSATLIPDLINLLYLSEDRHRLEGINRDPAREVFGEISQRWNFALFLYGEAREKYLSFASRLAFQPIPCEMSALAGVSLGTLLTVSASGYGLLAGLIVGTAISGPLLGILLIGPAGAILGYTGAAYARGAAKPIEALGEQQVARLLRKLNPRFVYRTGGSEEEDAVSRESESPDE